MAGGVKNENAIIYSFIIIVLILVDASTIFKHNRGSHVEISDIFGERLADPKSMGQIKRDTSLSYAATNIDSKEGTRVKTITVIKNHSGKNNGKLVINPEFHKNEEWANAFRDNFDTYGGIPDVPGIDDLFDFVKKKSKDDDGKKGAPNPKSKEIGKKEFTKPVDEPSSEIEITTPPVQKIKGDAELVPGLKKNQTSARSQSLGLDKVKTREPLSNSNYTSSEESGDIFFEKYIQEIPKGYDYPKPCPQGGKSVVSITNPSSGRTYDIPVEEDSPATPYIAPSINKKNQLPGLQSLQNNTQSVASTFVRPNFSVNSILPPLQTNSATTQDSLQPLNTVNSQTQITQQQGGGIYTSQRPYVAPNIRNSVNTNIASTLRPLYRNDIATYRGSSFLLGPKRVNVARSRGLKY
ncbi:uncharacterized protein LOC129242076 [Anastrepha obliqua]|uniref:uncharacterized protein LOC129242076 n=1 Tax=Anastrepha obliqua TaxID=95512 RepID=UPI00240A6579|nr:uncharacterized protein LOC129242076 [Anastrepha obliqua]